MFILDPFIEQLFKYTYI